MGQAILTKSLLQSEWVPGLRLTKVPVPDWRQMDSIVRIRAVFVDRRTGNVRTEKGARRETVRGAPQCPAGVLLPAHQGEIRRAGPRAGSLCAHAAGERHTRDSKSRALSVYRGKQSREGIRGAGSLAGQ